MLESLIYPVFFGDSRTTPQGPAGDLQPTQQRPPDNTPNSFPGSCEPQNAPQRSP